MLPGDHQTTRSPDLCTPAHLSQGRLGVCKLNNGHHLAAGQDHGETADSLTSSAAAAAMAWELYPCTFPGGGGRSCQRQWEPRNIWILLLLECLSRMSGRLPRGRGNTVASTPDTIAMPRLPSTDLCKPWKQSQNRPSFCTNPYFKLIPLGAGQRASGQPRTQPLG